MLNALKRRIVLLEAELGALNAAEGAGGKALSVRQHLQQTAVRVTVAQDDFMLALRNLTPSLSEQELRRYQQLKSEFETSRQ